MRSYQLRASFGAQTRYILRSVWQDLVKKKFGTLLTVLVIGVSLTIPTVSYLLWKNTHLAATQFYPEPEITIYLHKNLTENDANTVVEKIRQQTQQQTETLTYLSRQQSLAEFRAWSGFGEELDILDDNPLPAVVLLKPKKAFNNPENIQHLRENLQRIKGVESIKLDNDWLKKLTALTWLIARIAIICTLLMAIAVSLVIGNSVRSDVASSRSSIETMQLLGATDHFIARPFLYTGMFYGLMGSLLAMIISSLVIHHFTNAVKYVTDIFTVKFELNGLTFDEALLLIISCIFIGWLSAKIATRQHIQRIGTKHSA